MRQGCQKNILGFVGALGLCFGALGLCFGALGLSVPLFPAPAYCSSAAFKRSALGDIVNRQKHCLRHRRVLPPDLLGVQEHDSMSRFLESRVRSRSPLTLDRR